MGFTGFFTELNLLFPDFTRFHWVLLGFMGPTRSLGVFTGIKWVLLAFIKF